jgi:metal-responsive CopG/Arc/MetJ family transcriptional regulator
MSKRMVKRGRCEGKSCRFIGAWFPAELVSQIDKAVVHRDSDRSKLLRVALQEKLAGKRMITAAK